MTSSNPIQEIFGIKDDRGKEILESVEKLFMENKSPDEVINGILENKKFTENERFFSIYAAGFVGGRHVAFEEVVDVIGFDRFKSMMDEDDSDFGGVMYG